MDWALSLGHLINCHIDRFCLQEFDSSGGSGSSILKTLDVARVSANNLLIPYPLD